MNARAIDDNLVLLEDGSVCCRHCDTQLGTNDSDFLPHARWTRRPAEAAGPHIRDQSVEFSGRPIELRQAFCPGCLVALHTEILPADENSLRFKRVQPSGVSASPRV